MATRNPANSPVEVGCCNPIFYRVLYIQTVVGLGISEPSTVSKVKVRFFEVQTFTYVTDWQKKLQQSGVLFE